MKLKKLQPLPEVVEVKTTWTKFEIWVHSWFPGLKTKVTLGLGILGSGAATLQEFVGGLPVTEYVSTRTMALVATGLFVLAFWFKDMGKRVEDNS